MEWSLYVPPVRYPLFVHFSESKTLRTSLFHSLAQGKQQLKALGVIIVF